MFSYTIVEWLFFFYFYCFFGWIFESAYVSLQKKKFVNRGFMQGPFLPIYGSGAIMMLIVSRPFQGNVLLTYLAGCVGATVLELITGIGMEALFKVRYWDYSKQRFNYKGYICLSSTLTWGFLTIAMTKVLHSFVEGIVLAIPHAVITGVTVALSLIIIVDFTLSFKAAMDLRDILIGMDKVREEMERIHKRLDVIIAITNSEIEIQKQERKLRMEELTEELEARFERMKGRILTSSADVLVEIREEFFELRSKYQIEKEHRHQFKSLRSLYQRHLLKDNPSMYSARFSEALEELKKAVEEWKQK